MTDKLSNEFARITLAEIDNGVEDNDCLIRILCMINSELMIIGGEWFGKVINHGATYPFVLSLSGDFIYGTNDEGIIEVEHSSITKRKMVEGEFITVSGVDDGEPFESVFRITGIYKY